MATISPVKLSSYSAFYDTSALARVDRDAGIIHGVSVITEGAALGHGAWIDTVTLQQVVSVASEYKTGLRVNNDHGSDLFAAAGFLQDFRIEKRNGTSRVIANLHILESETHREKLLELAATIPDTFGLSVVMSGIHEKRDGKTYLRCSELLSADLVPEPAANPTGLFSKPKTNLSYIMDEKELSEKISAAVAEAVEARFAGMKEEMKALMDGEESPEKTEEELMKEEELHKEEELSRITELTKVVAKEFVTALRIKQGPAVSPETPAAPVESFEDKVIALRIGGKTKGEAISLAARQNPNLHKNYITRLNSGEAKSIEVV